MSVNRETEALDGLAGVFVLLPDRAAIKAFLNDLCTPAELAAMIDRWRIVPLIAEGVPYRQIHERTGVSVTTIGRVARALDYGAGGYRAALKTATARNRSGSKRAL